MNYRLSFTEYRFRCAIAKLTDEAGNVHEFRERNKRQAKLKVYDFIGKQRALIFTDDHSMISAMSRREMPMNIKVKFEKVRR